jgi:hypothetical protein
LLLASQHPYGPVLCCSSLLSNHILIHSWLQLRWNKYEIRPSCDSLYFGFVTPGGGFNCYVNYHSV